MPERCYNHVADFFILCTTLPQALLGQEEVGRAVPDLQKAVRLSSGDDTAVMREVLDRARAQLPAGSPEVGPTQNVVLFGL